VVAGAANGRRELVCGAGTRLSVVGGTWPLGGRGRAAGGWRLGGSRLPVATDRCRWSLTRTAAGDRLPVAGARLPVAGGTWWSPLATGPDH